MATAVFFHAHPDDEAIATGGTMLLAARAGHRVVVVCATDGALGESPGLEDAGDPSHIASVRQAELREAGRILGAERVEFLGYADSGMEDEPTNDHPDCFWQADLDEAAQRLGKILREEQADLITCYDDHGTYGHPDHIQVHRVGVRAAELEGVELVYEATVNRDHLLSSMDEAMTLAEEAGVDDLMTDEERADFDDGNLGVPAEVITHHIDVRSVLSEKRAAMEVHRSQITDDSFFMKMPPDAFAVAFGTEWYTRRGVAQGGPIATDLFEPLEG